MIRALLLALLAVPALAVDSPHDRPDACLVCHDATASGGVGAPKPSIPTCTACHASEARDMHAVGALPTADVTVPKGWPLEDGRITCATCHAEPSCDAARSKAVPYHRGGPYATAQTFCFECHHQEDFGRSDPHHPAPGDLGTCTACHVRPPKEGASPADSDLRVKPGEVCVFCHGADGHLGTATHLGKHADTALPTDDGAIACWTCHDVHTAPAAHPQRPRPGADVIRGLAGWGALERQAPEPGHPPMLARPLDDGALCAACHGEGP